MQRINELTWKYNLKLYEIGTVESVDWSSSDYVLELREGEL